MLVLLRGGGGIVAHCSVTEGHSPGDDSVTASVFAMSVGWKIERERGLPPGRSKGVTGELGTPLGSKLVG